MKRSLSVLLIILQISCSEKAGINSGQVNVADSAYHEMKQEGDSIPTEFTEYQLSYIVSVAEGYDYDSLRAIAIETSEFLKFRFDTMERYYNKQRKKIILPENYDDEMWAGEYYFRRYGDSIVSIEMRDAYIDTLTDKNEEAKALFYADTLKMFVVADMNTNKKCADSLASLLQRWYKKTRVIPTQIFMGCMH